MYNYLLFVVYIFLIPPVLWMVCMIFKPVRKFTFYLFNSMIGGIQFLLVYHIGVLSVSLLLRTFAIHYESVDCVVKKEIINIASFDISQDYNSSVSDLFVLGSGSISTDNSVQDYYYYYKKEDNGRLKLDKIDSNSVSLELNDDVTPSIVTNKVYGVTNHVPTKLGELLGFKNISEEDINESKTDIVMYIPKGSVIKPYDPNL